MLELYEVKVSCTVLRRERGSNPSDLADTTIESLGSTCGVSSGLDSILSIVWDISSTVVMMSSADSRVSSAELMQPENVRVVIMNNMNMSFLSILLMWISSIIAFVLGVNESPFLFIYNLTP